MRQIFILFIILISSCNQNNDTQNRHIDKETEIKEIKEVLYNQQACWNKGDIDGFMNGYWVSDKLIFTSADHSPAYGWHSTLERYKNSYPTKEDMGEFKFNILDIELHSNNTANLYGTWELIRRADHPSGECWIALKKFNNNWLITKDSTTSNY